MLHSLTILLAFCAAAATVTAGPPAHAAKPAAQRAAKDTVRVYGRFEMPSVSDSTWLIDDAGGRYALEYSPAQKHALWVAWQLYSGFGHGVRTAGDPWKRDGRIPETQNIDPRNRASGAIDYKSQRMVTDTMATITYDRGHLCPSQDRTSDPEVPGDETRGRAINTQTFIFSNCSPQLPAFNRGIWEKLESCIARWGRTPGDTLYICAGGSITMPGGVALHTVPSGIAVPKYYFKAVLRKRGGSEWSAIGFWLEHRDWGRSNADFTANIGKIAVTVDQIEALTGLDLFHSLPAAIQEAAEKQKNFDDWSFIP